MSEITNHCIDCCCARSWEALGVTTYTGKSIVEHIEELRAKQKDLYDALEMYRHYRDSHMGASSSKVTQAYRGEMNDKIDAALRKARGDSE